METFLQLLLTRTAGFPGSDRAPGPSLAPKHLSRGFVDAVLHPYSPQRHPASHCLPKEKSQVNHKQIQVSDPEPFQGRVHQC